MAVARNNRHNAAFVVGSVLGAVAGAAVALWKTPFTGEELRAKLTGGASHETATGAQTYVASPSTGTTVREERSLKDKVISGVEKTLAPVVGVELGKTANASGAETLAAGEIKVNAEQGSSTRLRRQRSWGEEQSEATTSTGSEAPAFGLSRDKVDADQWAAAYGEGAKAPSTSSGPGTTEATRTEAESTEYGSTLLRHPHAWKDDSGTAATSDTDEPKIGLSMDKVDADQWAAAYGTAADTTATSASTPDAEPAGTEATTTEYGSTRLRRQRSWGESREDDTTSDTDEPKIGLSMDKVDADEWAAAYGTQAPSGSTGETRPTEAHTMAQSEHTSREAEAEAKTRTGAKPAFPGSDEAGHQPADRTAPDTNVADVDRNAAERAGGTDIPMEEAASVEDLTTPQVDRTPDSLQAHDERAYHPFPKLGGKEDRA
jgi:gas vesicle protein